MKNWRLKGVALGLGALLLVLTLSLAGCGGSKQANDSSKNAGGKQSDKAAVEFPTKPMEMTVLFGAGSGADLLARKVADLASKELGQPIAVVNRTGAAGAVGYSYVKDQKPDGYNFVWNSNSINTAYHQGNMKFDYKAFAGVAELTTEPVSIAVKADAPWKDINEFIDYAKKNPGKVRIGNSGLGSFTHLAAVALENKTGAKFTHVPFGQGLAVSSLLGGKIEASSQLPAEIMSQVKAGQVRILAVTGEQRLASLPDVPTFKEKGIDLTLSLWRGIAVPAGTPQPVIEKLEAAFKKVAENQEFKDFAKQMGANIEFRGAADFDKFIAQQDKELADLMEQIGMKKQ
ncbi:Bordetella uptake gene [Moorella glycerini]|uniref:Tripartite tricarboxylate transporter family receptor n=1 Tax=Neomoorella stamsii TaxID=1266720 RepID=A0A9X7J462_9FIRM|nr:MULTISPECIES: tripartite tricarboxylate transporter substrate binding protein [Moorella]PRR73560.1 Tripartite tricarboxylate transporter family receptor [Moorella stamsii]CEP69329.1 Bordetella uptake gene [Moorella glycerini]